MIGYCTQKDAIFPMLTVEEHLQFVTKIKGILAAIREQVVEKAILQLSFKDFRTKPSW